MTKRVGARGDVLFSCEPRVANQPTSRHPHHLNISRTPKHLLAKDGQFGATNSAKFGPHCGCLSEMMVDTTKKYLEIKPNEIVSNVHIRINLVNLSIIYQLINPSINLSNSQTQKKGKV
jgi:hypothetical protein